jgi:hypothetical protein
MSFNIGFSATKGIAEERNGWQTSLEGLLLINALRGDFLDRMTEKQRHWILA